MKSRLNRLVRTLRKRIGIGFLCWLTVLPALGANYCDVSGANSGEACTEDRFLSVELSDEAFSLEHLGPFTSYVFLEESRSRTPQMQAAEATPYEVAFRIDIDGHYSLTAWTDYDGDGNFSAAAGERRHLTREYYTAGDHVLSGSIIVPATVIPKLTRMRLQIRFSPTGPPGTGNIVIGNIIHNSGGSVNYGHPCETGFCGQFVDLDVQINELNPLCSAEANGSSQVFISRTKVNGVEFNSGSSRYTHSGGSSVQAVKWHRTKVEVDVQVDVDEGAPLYVSGWIDFNQDNKFGAGEGFGLAWGQTVFPGVTTLTRWVLIPADAGQGITSMRLIAKVGSPPDPCDSGFVGEVEDRFVLLMDDYCRPVVNDRFHYPLVRVAFAESSFTLPSVSGYFDILEDRVFHVNAAETYEVSVQTSETIGQVAIVVDADRNGAFESSGDTSEILAILPAGSRFRSGAVTIPGTASVGLTRLRIIYQTGDGPIDVCPGNLLGTVVDSSIEIGPKAPPCPSVAGNQTEGYLSKIRINGQSVSSGADAYSDFTATVFKLLQDQPYTVEAEVTNLSNVEQLYHLNAWVDLDRDGQFHADDERFLLTPDPVDFGPGIATISSTIELPKEALSGITLMRITLSSGENADISPCANGFSGEVEDYAVVLLPPYCHFVPGSPYWQAGWQDGEGSIVNVELNGQPVATGADRYSDLTQHRFHYQSTAVNELKVTVVTEPEAPDSSVSSHDLTVRAYIDYNQDGLFTQSDEELILGNIPPQPFGTFVLSGSFDPAALPLGAVPGDTRMRVILHRSDQSANPCDFVFTGEIEDYSVGLSLPGDYHSSLFDFGDAPASYGVLLGDDGARHRLHINSGVFLGSIPSDRDKTNGSSDGMPSLDASGDDSDGGDDEDGISSLSALVPGHLASIDFVSVTGGVVDAWMDFNRNGVFDVAEKLLFVEGGILANGATLTRKTFMVPTWAQPGDSFGRFRISSPGGLGPLGEAYDGEVEDHPIRLIASFPAATNDSGYVVERGKSVIVPVERGVLINDVPDHILGRAVLVSGPQHALDFELFSDGSFRYLHDGGGALSDQFHYHVAYDSGLSSTVPAEVQIDISAALDLPVTYQGLLQRQGEGVDGTVDFELAVFDSEIGGLMVAGPILHPNVQLKDGLFSLSMVFPGLQLEGERRWLEIRFKHNSIAFETLTPRQPLGSTAFAHQAETADELDGGVALSQLGADVVKTDRDVVFSSAIAATRFYGDGSQLTGTNPSQLVRPNLGHPVVTVDLAGRIGIGTTTPDTRLTIAAPTEPTLSFHSRYRGVPVGSISLFSGTSGGTIRYSLLDDLAGLMVVANDHATGHEKISLFVNNGSHNHGAIGIGTVEPRVRTALHIVHQGTPDDAGWAVLISNQDGASGAGGIQINNDGFLEASSNAFDSASGIARLSSVGEWTSVSDRRRKKDVNNLGRQLDNVELLSPVSFRYRSDQSNGMAQVGFIAQDVEQVYPSFVLGDGTKTLDYASLSVPAIKVLQEQNSHLESIREAIRIQRIRLEKLAMKLGVDLAE